MMRQEVMHFAGIDVYKFFLYSSLKIVIRVYRPVIEVSNGEISGIFGDSVTIG